MTTSPSRGWKKKLNIKMINFSHFDNSPTLNLDLKQAGSWIGSIIVSEHKIMGTISYIFCSDDELLKINKKFLNHDSLTDIISFPELNSTSIISGEIYISIDRVKENAINYNVEFKNELHRVMAHGVLHFVGYGDSTTEDKAEMRSKEDYYLNLLPQTY